MIRAGLARLGMKGILAVPGVSLPAGGAAAPIDKGQVA